MRFTNGKNNYRLTISVLALFLILAMILILLPGSALAETDSVTRLSGANRWATSANVALEAYPDGSGNVIIARGDNAGGWADGLAGGYLAGVLDAPILLTAPDSLHESVVAAIGELDPDKAYILGGTAAVSAGVEAELVALGLDIKRIAGANREATAAQIAGMGNVADNTAFVVQGRAPADSMVAGAAAFAKSYPILLVNKDSVPVVTANAITNLGIENIIIVGGSGVVSADVAAELGNIAGVSNVTRLSGVNREATSVAFAKGQFPGWVDFSIVNGRAGLADAVGASVFGNPILYVNSIPEIVKDYLDDEVTNSSILRIFGGTAVVSANVGNLLWDIIDEAPPGPNFTVFPFSDIWGERWKANTEITIEIYDGDETEVYYRNSDSTGHFQLQFDETFDVQAGQVVTINDGVTKRSHTVRHCIITDVDIDEDKVYGEADPNQGVLVGVYHVDVDQFVDADSNGQWAADFTGLHDLDTDSEIHARVFDKQGNDTGYEWRFPNPHFTVQPRRNDMWGYEWPSGSMLDVEVFDNDEDRIYFNEAGIEVNHDEHFNYHFKDLDLKSEYKVVITEPDSELSREHIIEYVRVTSYDIAENKVHGESAPNASLEVVVNLGDGDWDNWPRLWDIEADGNGKWMANFGGLHNIEIDTIIEVFVHDEHGNQTFLHQFRAPDLSISVNPFQNIIVGYDWPLDELVSITIDDGNGGYTDTATPNEWGDIRLEIDPLEFDLASGHVITLSQDDGGYELVYIVTEVEVLVVDESTPGEVTVTGKASADAEVGIFPFNWDIGSKTVTASSEGKWEVTFDHNLYDLGEGVYATERDGLYKVTWTIWPDDTQ